MTDESHDELLDQLWARVRAYRDEDDAAAVLNPAALECADDLLRQARTPEGGIPDVALYSVAWLRLYRYLAREVDGLPHDNDLAEAVRHFNTLSRAGSDLVSEDLVQPVGIEAARRGSAILHQLLAESDTAKLDLVVDLLRSAVAVLPPEDYDRAVNLANLSVALNVLFDRSADVADLDESLAHARAAAEAVPEDHAGRADVLASLGGALRTRFRVMDDPRDIDEAVTALSEAVGLLRTGRSASWNLLINMSQALWQRSFRSGDPADLSQAIALSQEALATAAFSPANRMAWRHHLALMLQQRKGTGDLDEAITLRRATVAELSADVDRAHHLFRLARALHDRYEQDGAEADLDEAIEVGQAARRLVRSEWEAACWHLNWLANILFRRYLAGGDLASLEECIAVHRSDLAHAVGSDRAIPLANISLRLCNRFERLGDRAAVDEATALAREAVAIGAHRLLCLSSLLEALRVRYLAGGDPSDLEEAAVTGCGALPVTAAEEDRATFLNYLARVLSARFRSSGTVADLDEAIAWGREALQEAAAQGEIEVHYLSDLGLFLRNRFEQSGASGDLDEALSLARAALAAAPEHHHGRPTFLSNLGLALWLKSLESDDPAGIDEAVSVSRLAVELSAPGDTLLPARLSNLGRSLRLRSNRGTELHALEDAYEAVGVGRAAVAATPLTDAERPRWTFNLVVSLVNRYRRVRNPADLDEAISLGLQVVATMLHPHPEMSDRLVFLADTYVKRYELDKNARDAHAAIDFYRQAASGTSGPIAQRTDAARSWGRFAASASRWPTALDGYRIAVGLMPLLAWRGVDQGSQRRLLTRWAMLSGEAASCALMIGEARAAVELLEQGRAVLWSQLLDTRTDLKALHTARPDLARRLDAIRNEL